VDFTYQEETIMRSFGFLVLVLVAVSATSVLAGPLAPSKPSDIVTLMPNASDGSNGACGPQQLNVDGIISSTDGSVAPFTIPPKAVLVLTGGSWSDISLAANVNAFLELRLETASTSNQLLVSPAVRTDSAGTAAGSFTVEPGIVIKPGASLCAHLVVDNASVISFPRLTGFIAKDK
jgi:hypothetical protein